MNTHFLNYMQSVIKHCNEHINTSHFNKSNCAGILGFTTPVFVLKDILHLLTVLIFRIWLEITLEDNSNNTQDMNVKR